MISILFLFFIKKNLGDQSKSTLKSYVFELFLIFCKPALDVGLGVEKIKYSYNSFVHTVQQVCTVSYNNQAEQPRYVPVHNTTQHILM